MGKKLLVIIIAGVVGLAALPATGRAWHHGGGWYGPGLFAGGLLLGAAIARPWYAPAPAYVYPAPAVVYAPPPPVYVPSAAYAYPDPAVAPQASAAPSGPGQWVEVPGQAVNGRWVPAHKVWVPDGQ